MDVTSKKIFFESLLISKREQNRFILTSNTMTKQNISVGWTNNIISSTLFFWNRLLISTVKKKKKRKKKGGKWDRLRKKKDLYFLVQILFDIWENELKTKLMNFAVVLEKFISRLLKGWSIRIYFLIRLFFRGNRFVLISVRR